MSAEQISKRYASSLLQLTKGDIKLQAQLDEQLLAIVDLLSNKDINKVITSPVVNSEVINAVFTNIGTQLNSPEVFKQFLRVLVDARRVDIIPQIQQSFHSALLDAQGLVEASVTSAVALDAGETDQIKAKLEAMLGKKVQLSTKVDKSILGGFVVKIDNSQIDMSLKTKLDNMTKFAVS